MQTQPGAKHQVTRSATTLLATGGYVALLSVVFMSPFLLSARAQENDIFMVNLYFSPILYLIGSTVLIAGLDKLGLRHVLTGTLAIGNPAVLGLVSWIAGNASANGIQGIAVGLLTDASLLMLVSLVVIAGVHTWQIGVRTALLAASGAALVSLSYFLFGTRYYAFGETVSSVPPYLNDAVIACSLVAGVAVLWGSLRLGKPWRRGPAAAPEPAQPSQHVSMHHTPMHSEK